MNMVKKYYINKTYSNWCKITEGLRGEVKSVRASNTSGFASIVCRAFTWFSCVVCDVIGEILIEDIIDCNTMEYDITLFDVTQ